MKFLKYFFASFCIFFVVNAHATDLWQVYQQAVLSDPTYKTAQATWMASRLALPLSVTAILPSLDLSTDINRQYIDNLTSSEFGSNSTFDNTQRDYTVSVSEQLFNFSDWMAIKNAHSTVKAAEATFALATQDLILRTATAYFAVLQAAEDLRYTQAERAAIGRQLDQSKEQYKVGLIAITNVYDAQASYDSVVAQEIAAKNTLADQLENLRAITGVYYPNLASLGEKMPLVKPDPADIDTWVQTAAQQNYSIMAARFSALAARQNIGIQAAERLPTVTATGGYQLADNSNPAGFGMQRTRTAQIGLTANFPVFQGGAVFVKTRQAAYQYAEAGAQLENTYRSIVAQTRQAYLGVISGISQIKADHQTIISSRSDLEATTEAYKVGTRTMVDVLNAQSALYAAEKNYAQDRYNYLISILTLKFAAGTLKPADLMRMNSWLTKNINFNPAENTPKQYSQSVAKPKKSIKKSSTALPAPQYNM